MDKVLKVKKSFLGVEIGDTFEYNKDENTYNCDKSNIYSYCGNNECTVKSNYSVSLSVDETKGFIEKGYLEVVKNDKKSEHVNVFDKIDSLIRLYTADLNNLDEDMKDSPACMKVEKQTVLENMINTLWSLKQYKY